MSAPTQPPSFEGYPFGGRFLDVGGARMHYLDEGSGAPVVMVHGNPTWSYYYRNLVLALRDTHRVIVPDHIGMGLSDKPDDAAYPYRLERYVDDLGRLIDHTEPNAKISLVVHDWGGMIGLAWAVRNPERIERMIILNTAFFPMPAHKSVPWELRLVRSFLGPVLVRGLNLFCKGAARRCVTAKPLTAGERRAYLAPYDSWAHRRAVLRFVQDIPVEPDEPSYDVVADVAEKIDLLREVPTLLLWGMRDFIFDPDYLHEIERRMPQAEVHRFEQAGHYLLEDALTEVRPMIERFRAVPVPAERP